MPAPQYDVIIVGAGNAALTAALAALKAGARTAVLERAPKQERGGNSHFTDGAMRFAHNGINDLRPVIPAMTDQEAAMIELPPYPPEQYAGDVARVNSNQVDAELVDCLAHNSLATMQWLAECGAQFEMIYDNQSFLKNGKHHFWGALSVRTIGRGIGGVQRLFEMVEQHGGEIRYEARATRLLMDGGKTTGVQLENGHSITAPAVVLACGGFEANADMRAQHLGEAWRGAIVRGTAFNTGDGLEMALSAGARRHGNWKGCHAVSMGIAAPEYGDRSVQGDVYKKHSYPLGIIVNKLGKRFVDEGADYRNYTYAHYGAEVLRQPGGVAYQVFDERVRHLLRSEYWEPTTTALQADTMEELASKMDLDQQQFLKTVAEFNADISSAEFNPHEKDGKASRRAVPPKSNWAQPLDTPPFRAFPVKCGITFTFGGIKVNTAAQVLSDSGDPIAGLHAAGEMVAGLFSQRYPGGSGLMSGSVFGKLAGETAAQFAAQHVQ